MGIMMKGLLSLDVSVHLSEHNLGNGMGICMAAADTTS